MTPTSAIFHEKMNIQLDRIARATSVIRTRQEDGERRVANGGSSLDLTKKVARAAVSLKRLADELEKAIA